jgi:proline iminopeptidase
MIEIKDTIKVEDLLYPKSKPYNTGYLDVGDGHSLYYQQYGNPKGPAVLLVHGGPGGGISVGENLTRIHDPNYFRIIAVDQRGCGQSKPHVADDTKKALRHNTPDKLADDFEKIREYLEISKWHIFGHSWGACLAPYYAVRYPDTIASMTISGIWMHTADEIDWYINRMGLFQPEAEATLLALLPKNMKRFDRLNALYKAITGKDKKHALKIAEAQGYFEHICCYFDPSAKQIAEQPKKTAKEKKQFQTKMISLGALEIFFMKENPLPAGWFKTKAVQKAFKSIKDISIIQGRYDIVCPPTTAYELHMAHPHSRLTMVHYAGHKSSDPQLMQAIIRENNRLKK